MKGTDKIEDDEFRQTGQIVINGHIYDFYIYTTLHQGEKNAVLQQRHAQLCKAGLAMINFSMVGWFGDMVIYYPPEYINKTLS